MRITSPIEAMVLAFEASGCDGSLGVEGRILAGLLSLGWCLVPDDPEYDGPDHVHRWVDPDKLETFCRDCGDVRKDDPRKTQLDQPTDGPDTEHAQLLAFRAVAAEMIAVDGSEGLWDARRMIEARNTFWLLCNRPDKVDQSHLPFIPADIEAMGAVMARVARMTVR